MTSIHYKRKIRKVLWRTGRVIEDQKGMAKLRHDAYHRSGGYCECRLADSGRPYCGQRVTWTDSQLHHVVSRAHGGSDIIENVCFVTRKCHRELTGLLHWSQPVLES